MDRTLVVIDDTDSHRDLLREAASVTEAKDAELVLFSWISEEEFEDDIETLEVAESEEGSVYTDHSPADFVERFIESFVEEVLGDDAPTYDMETAVAEDDETAGAILEAADEHDCTHIYLIGRRRTPAGKVLFGNVSQDVILGFDGYVTIAME